MKSLKIIGLSCFAMSLVAGCAKDAAMIEPAAISTSRYDGWDCKKLTKERAFLDDALVRASASQDQAAGNDKMMVFLIGVPTSGGGIPGEVARLKGEQEAVRRSMVERSCPAA